MKLLSSSTPSTHPDPAPRSTWRWLLCLVILAGSALRLLGLDRWPPGLHFDEAVYGLMAQEIVAGARPVYFPAFTGREPLYMYVMAGFFAAIGATGYAIRLTSAFIGIATIPLAFALGRALFGRRVGLVAAALLAVSYWHITVSRNGYPNILIPPIEAASAFFLWRGWRAGRGRDWAVGGALAGLVLYTYLAARFYPVFLALLIGLAAVLDFPTWRRRLPGIALAGIAAVLVFAPLGWHFWRHPEDFVQRANQVLAWQHSSGAELAAIYLGNLKRTALAFLVPGQGDPRWHYNLPGRAIFQPLVACAFLAGVAVCLRRARDLRYTIPLLWIAVMTLPGLLTDEMQPAGQRIFGMFPALVLVPAIGIVALGDGLAAALTRRAGSIRGARAARLSSVLPAGLALALVLVDARATLRDYRAWVRLPETVRVFNADYVRMAAAGRAALAAGQVPVLLSEHYKHPTIAFLAPELVDGAIWAEPRMALPLPGGAPPDDAGARGSEAGASDASSRAAAAFPAVSGRSAERVYLVPKAYLAPDLPAARWLEAQAREREALAVGGPSGDPARVEGGRDASREAWPDVLRFVVPSPAQSDEAPPGAAAPDASAPARAEFAGELAVDQGPAIPSLAGDRDEPLEIVVDGTVLASPAAPRGMAIHLRDAAGTTWAQADGLGYLAEQWRPGDRVRAWWTLDLDRAMPPGRYTATLLVTDAGGRPLPYQLRPGAPCVDLPEACAARLAALGPPGGLAAPVARVLLRPEGARRAGEDARSDRVFGDGLAIMEASLPTAELPPGGRAVVELLWARLEPPGGAGGSQAPVPFAGADTIRFRLEGGDRTHDLGAMPIAAAHPPARWGERELLRGRYALALPAGVEPGDYRLSVSREGGPADPAGAGAVAAEGIGRAGPAETFGLGTLRVGGPARVFEAPVMTHPVEAVFGSTVRLLGYDLAPPLPVPGQALTLTLAWQAIETPPEEGTVFVHLGGAEGSPAAQHDGLPALGARPFTGWLPGEVVLDAHPIQVPADLPPDSALRVGIYDPGTGRRWSVQAPGMAAEDDRLRLGWGP